MPMELLQGTLLPGALKNPIFYWEIGVLFLSSSIWRQFCLRENKAGERWIWTAPQRWDVEGEGWGWVWGVGGGRETAFWVSNGGRQTATWQRAGNFREKWDTQSSRETCVHFGQSLKKEIEKKKEKLKRVETRVAAAPGPTALRVSTKEKYIISLRGYLLFLPKHGCRSFSLDWQAQLGELFRQETIVCNALIFGMTMSPHKKIPLGRGPPLEALNALGYL